ncbi:MAG: trehalose 6-phosphate synthase [Chitinispirillia bacterium]|jgi:hydroxymethylpyrimidine pyrophosphatase-like HAD family hydrolase
MDKKSSNNYFKKKQVRTLDDFYSLMRFTKNIRTEIVMSYLKESKADKNRINSLKYAFDKLNNIKHESYNACLSIDKKSEPVLFDLRYEENELYKDILFLTKGEEALYDHFNSIHPSFRKQIEINLPKFKNLKFGNIFTDRDGTVNNYCGRYLSSVQSVYNAVFLTRFSRQSVKNAVLLTSAPLENGGMVDVCTMPHKEFILSGSKGREYRDKEWNRGTFHIDSNQQNQIDKLNSKIADVIKKPPYKKFSYIGSGFQQKFGQTTIARQDISNSVPKEESLEFKFIIHKIVSDLDPENIIFRIEDTGLDIEIILTISDPSASYSVKDFDKGDGVSFLDQRLKLNMAKVTNLICGDTSSDVPMLEVSLKKRDKTMGVFVTKDPKLQYRVRNVLPTAIFVDEPDILVTLLNEISKY